MQPVLDKTSMFKVESTKADGSLFKHQVRVCELLLRSSHVCVCARMCTVAGAADDHNVICTCMHTRPNSSSIEPQQRQVKPLQLIWTKFPQWSEANTVRDTATPCPALHSQACLA